MANIHTDKATHKLPPRLNGCLIVGAVQVKGGFIILVLTDPKDDRTPARYATAHYSGGDQWNQGDYGMTFQEALVSFLGRAMLESSLY